MTTEVNSCINEVEDPRIVSSIPRLFISFQQNLISISIQIVLIISINMLSKTALFQVLLLIPSVMSVPAASPIPEDVSAVVKTPAVKSDTKAGGSSTLVGINLKNWSLQLPIGSKDHPVSIPGTELQTSSKKPPHFSDYFQINNGIMKLIVKGSPKATGCVTTKNSKHCRTEFKQTTPKSWDPKKGTNRLTATVRVIQTDDSKHGTCIGQIHIDDKISVRPVAELYVNHIGVVSLGVEQTREGHNQKVTDIDTVKLGEKFKYTLGYEKGALYVEIDGRKHVLSSYKLNNPRSYFKAGNYNQGEGASEIDFFDIQTKHGD